MKDTTRNYDIPDFGPDDDTEEMIGVPIYRPLPENEELFPEWDFLPELPKLPQSNGIGEKTVLKMMESIKTK